MSLHRRIASIKQFYSDVTASRGHLLEMVLLLFVQGAAYFLDRYFYAQACLFCLVQRMLLMGALGTTFLLLCSHSCMFLIKSPLFFKWFNKILRLIQALFILFNGIISLRQLFLGIKLSVFAPSFGAMQCTRGSLDLFWEQVHLNLFNALRVLWNTKPCMSYGPYWSWWIIPSGSLSVSVLLVIMTWHRSKSLLNRAAK